jgi:hypothetical protein
MTVSFKQISPTGSRGMATQREYLLLLELKLTVWNVVTALIIGLT